MSKPVIGFIGLGIMGRPMAGHVQRAGYPLAVVNFDPPLPEELLEAGAQVCSSNREVAENSDIIVIMVPDTPDVEKVLFDEDGVANGLSAGKLVIDMSSISPKATVGFAQKINALGCDYLDAPVSGGEPRAISGELTIMVGGPQTAFDRAHPVFETMGTTITLIGERNGDGQVCKVANQIIVGCNVQAAAEALLFASKAGADPRKVHAGADGRGGPVGDSGEPRPRMLDRNFEQPSAWNCSEKIWDWRWKPAGKWVWCCQTQQQPGSFSTPVKPTAIFNADAISVLKVLERMANHTLEG